MYNDHHNETTQKVGNPFAKPQRKKICKTKWGQND